jgi:hypothetical protein
MMMEIDGQPAFTVFKEYLDGNPDDLGSPEIIHLCVGIPLPEAHRDGYGSYVIRTPLGLDKSTGGLFFAGGGLEEGTHIQMTRRDADLIRRSAEASGIAIRERHPGQSPLMVLQFDCAGRGRALFGDQTAAIAVEPLRAALGAEVPWMGFHTHGEIAPLKGTTYYHNYTVVLCALYAKP